MAADNFQEAYLKEIGVQTPISSFFVQQNDEIKHELDSTVLKTAAVASPVSYQAQSADQTQGENEVGMMEVAEPASPQPLVSQALPSQESSPPSTHLLDIEKKAEVCRSCELAESRNKLVFGTGHQSADLMFVGDSPGRDEDLAGLPFAGRSGALFDGMLSAMGLSRDEVYLTNGVKCRPLHSRDPKPNEFSACEGWFIEQLEMVQPKMICLLGRVIAQSLLKTEMSLTELRQQQHTFRGIPVLVIDHPSYLLRSQQHKTRAWADLCRLKIAYQKLQTHH